MLNATGVDAMRWRKNATLPQGADDLYSYDGMNQLVDVQRGVLSSGHTSLTSKNFQQEWWLDATGNWSAFLEDSDGNGTWDISQARLHNAANEILSMSDPSLDLAHDRAGNMTVVPNPQSLIPNPQSLTYDAWNRLVRVSSGEVTIAEYEYDGLFRRVKKHTPSGSSVATIRDYYYSVWWQVLEEYLTEQVGESVLEQRFCWGVRYIDDLVLRERDATGDGVLDERVFAMQDANWNVTAIADSTGVIAERYRYDAYGRPIYLYPDGTVNPNGSAHAWPVLFTGRHLDLDTNLYHYRNRDYHYGLGRFVNRDPIGLLEDGSSLYRYVHNSPRVFVDPSGLDRRIVCWFGHMALEVQDRGRHTIYLEFNPRGYVETEPYPFFGAVPISDWIPSRPEQDQQLINTWRLLEKERQAGTVPGYWHNANPLFNCWVPAYMMYDYPGITFPPTSFPPGWDPQQHACGNCHAPQVRAWMKATQEERQNWSR